VSSDDRITHWLERIQAGRDESAIRHVWERYFERLVSLARRRLEGTPRRVADEEDVALSAFRSFCEAAQNGRFPDLADRDDLWRILFRMTTRKAVDLIRYNARQKRNIKGESAVMPRDPDGDLDRGLERIAGDEATPEFAAIVAEECHRLLAELDDDQLQSVATAKMEGYTNAEIAARLDCSLRTIERSLHLIRRIWEPRAARGESGGE
jgi:RNA polymerase sigma factor (sigma-70 family)